MVLFQHGTPDMIIMNCYPVDSKLESFTEPGSAATSLNEAFQTTALNFLATFLCQRMQPFTTN